MIGKIIFFPVTLLKKGIGGIFGIIKFIILLIIGIFRFIFGHILGSVIGAVIGFILGNKHVGIKFSGKKRKKKVNKPKES